MLATVMNDRHVVILVGLHVPITSAEQWRDNCAAVWRVRTHNLSLPFLVLPGASLTVLACTH